MRVTVKANSLHRWYEILAFCPCSACEKNRPSIRAKLLGFGLAAGRAQGLWRD